VFDGLLPVLFSRFWSSVPVTVLQVIRKRFRTIFLCLVLEVGALTGVPMRPEEIRELMQTLNQPKVAHVLKETDDDSEN
jgi:hypothetical protein